LRRIRKRQHHKRNLNVFNCPQNKSKELGGPTILNSSKKTFATFIHFWLKLGGFHGGFGSHIWATPYIYFKKSNNQIKRGGFCLNSCKSLIIIIIKNVYYNCRFLYCDSKFRLESKSSSNLKDTRFLNNKIPILNLGLPY